VRSKRASMASQYSLLRVFASAADVMSNTRSMVKPVSFKALDEMFRKLGLSQ
jgi:hypothetical protein